MASYRAAVIGCGRIGSTIDDEQKNRPQFRYPWAHAPAYVEAKGVELVAGSDLATERLEDFKQRWGVTALYTDYQEMLAKEKPDIVSVTTRTTERAEVVMAAAEAGVKAIYATKPMCHSLAEADAMIEVCRKHGVILAIACHKTGVRGFMRAYKLSKTVKSGPFRRWSATTVGAFAVGIATRLRCSDCLRGHQQNGFSDTWTVTKQQRRTKICRGLA